MPVAELSVQDLQTALDDHRPLTVLDVRSAADRADWWIPGSRYVDASAELARGESAALDAAARDMPKDRPVVAVCAKGRTSMAAAERLQQLGFDARSLAGGMTAWSDAWNTAETSFPGAAGAPAFTVIQVRRTGKGCLSYVVGAGREAVVIDPAVDPHVYLRIAKNHDWRIVGVLDTHVHADHVSRARAVAALTGAPLSMPAQQRVVTSFQPLAGGDTMAIDGLTLRAIQTPGHTTESMCFAADTRALFTGDTLFLDSVGRPDLVAPGDEPAYRARLLYHSIKDVLTALPGTLHVFPGHTGQPIPFDGVARTARLDGILAGLPLTTLPEDEFVAAVLARIPATPPNHLQIVRINEGKQAAPPDLQPLEAGANRCAVTQA